MITERLTFRAKYGQGDALVTLMKEANQVMPTQDILAARVYTDFTGTMFTCAVEFDYANLNTWAKASQGDSAQYGTPEFQAWFARMVACTETGDRQLLNSEKLF
ncbi:MAG: hypothetical protein AB7N24_01440 [Dehalococcoidia bacterium]